MHVLFSTVATHIWGELVIDGFPHTGWIPVVLDDQRETFGTYGRNTHIVACSDFLGVSPAGDPRLLTGLLAHELGHWLQDIPALRAEMTENGIAGQDDDIANIVLDMLVDTLVSRIVPWTRNVIARPHEIVRTAKAEILQKCLRIWARYTCVVDAQPQAYPHCPLDVQYAFLFALRFYGLSVMTAASHYEATADLWIRKQEGVLFAKALREAKCRASLAEKTLAHIGDRLNEFWRIPQMDIHLPVRSRDWAKLQSVQVAMIRSLGRLLQRLHLQVNPSSPDNPSDRKGDGDSDGQSQETEPSHVERSRLQRDLKVLSQALKQSVHTEAPPALASMPSNQGRNPSMDDPPRLLEIVISPTPPAPGAILLSQKIRLHLWPQTEQGELRGFRRYRPMLDARGDPIPFRRPGHIGDSGSQAPIHLLVLLDVSNSMFDIAKHGHGTSYALAARVANALLLATRNMGIKTHLGVFGAHTCLIKNIDEKILFPEDVGPDYWNRQVSFIGNDTNLPFMFEIIVRFQPVVVVIITDGLINDLKPVPPSAREGIYVLRIAQLTDRGTDIERAKTQELVERSVALIQERLTKNIAVIEDPASLALALACLMPHQPRPATISLANIKNVLSTLGIAMEADS